MKEIRVAAIVISALVLIGFECQIMFDMGTTQPPYPIDARYSVKGFLLFGFIWGLGYLSSFKKKSEL